jgi:hypothetical protein
VGVPLPKIGGDPLTNGRLGRLAGGGAEKESCGAEDSSHRRNLTCRVAAEIPCFGNRNRESGIESPEVRTFLRETEEILRVAQDDMEERSKV